MNTICQFSLDLCFYGNRCFQGGEPTIVWAFRHISATEWLMEGGKWAGADDWFVRVLLLSQFAHKICRTEDTTSKHEIIGKVQLEIFNTVFDLMSMS